MKYLAIFLSAFFLFFLVSPGILGKFPTKGDKFMVAIFHAIVFSILFSFCYYLISSSKIEGLEPEPTTVPTTVPTGPYQDWCTNIRLEGSNLFADCTATESTIYEKNGEMMKDSKNITDTYSMEGGAYCDKPIVFARNINGVHGLCCGECPVIDQEQT